LLISWAAAALLGVLGQALAVSIATLATRLRPFWRIFLLLAATALLADAAAAAFGYAAGRGLAELNRGSPFHRAVVGIFAMLAIPAITWATFRAAITIALRPRLERPGLIPFFTATALTAIGWCAIILPGVRMSDSNAPAEVSRISIALPRLPAALDGMTILLVGDLHVGRYVSPAQARRRLAPARSLKPDLIVCTGDLATFGDRRLREGAAVLDEMMPKGARYACLGNHERWIGETLASQELEAAGFQVLTNESRRIHVRGAELWLAGVNDPHTHADDLPAALAEVPRSAFTILLSHSPDIFGEAADRGVDLMLSGHTHGGQVVLPLIGATSSASRYGPRYASGLFRQGRTAMFVTRGVGDVIVPMRVYCNPEVALLTLTRPDGTRATR
jgi:predicted MPP superfamily phosphohydrolase